MAKPKSAQAKAFIEAAREAGCSEDEADVDRELKALLKKKSDKAAKKARE